MNTTYSFKQASNLGRSRYFVSTSKVFLQSHERRDDEFRERDGRRVGGEVFHEDDVDLRNYKL